MPEMSLADLRRLLPQAAPGMDGNYAVPSPIPVPPGAAPIPYIPPWLRDRMDRPAITNGYDRNAVQGDDQMRQYYLRHLVQEDI
jgi:hypothetical protein